MRKEQCQPQAGSIKKNRKSMANCRQCDRSKATGTVWHKEPEQQRFKKNVKVRAEAQKVKAGECAVSQLIPQWMLAFSWSVVGVVRSCA